jgi:phenylacetate-coenzyme A ligase PaaK-like adenylate-forming protein
MSNLEIDYEHVLNIPPYSLNKEDKQQLLSKALTQLTQYHSTHCEKYNSLLTSMDYKVQNSNEYATIPFLPVRLFKEYDLKSVQEADIVKTMTSSGTSGQNVSKIFLDRETSANQTKSLSKIINSFTGKARLPMIILDSSQVVKNRAMFSARGAGILGFSMFGKDIIYALDENMQLNVEALNNFLEKYNDQTILLFGFTFIIWQHFYEELMRTGSKFNIKNGVLIHGGGWKKLIDRAVTPNEFKKSFQDLCGIEKIYDYYGMVEQTGSINMECEYGFLHTSIFNDIIIRSHLNFKEVPIGEEGIIQTLSILPKSYPGHSLLTEDEGVIIGEDDCKCGRKGKYFLVKGRIKNAEIRGCSDTYTANVK